MQSMLDSHVVWSYAAAALFRKNGPLQQDNIPNILHAKMSSFWNNEDSRGQSVFFLNVLNYLNYELSIIMGWI